MYPFTKLYSPIYRNVVFPLLEVVRGRSTHRHLRSLSRNPFLSTEELESMRKEKLKRMVRYAYEHVPFYRKLFDEKGLDVEQVEGIDDLRAAGIYTSKEIVREAGDEILSDEYRKEALVDVGSGGSTGKPCVFYMTMDNWTMRMAVKYRGEAWVGKPIGTPTTIIWGHRSGMSFLKWMKYLLYWRVQNYQFLSAFKVGEEDLLGYISAVKRNGSRFLESYVTVVYEMARVIKKRGITPPKLDGILVGAEKLYDFQKEAIEDAFNCPVYNRYGCTEFSNVAGECRERTGMHINIDRVWLEVINEEGEAVVDEVGDLVITDLDNFAMPLIRYRIGDRGVLSSDTCSCGINFPLLKDVVGRTSQVLVTPQGKRMHDIYFIWLISRTPGVKRFKIIQRSVELLEVLLVPDGTMREEEITGYIDEKLSELRELGIKFEYNFVDDIPLTDAGKMLYFVSEVKQSTDD